MAGQKDCADVRGLDRYGMTAKGRRIKICRRFGMAWESHEIREAVYDQERHEFLMYTKIYYVDATPERQRMERNQRPCE